VRADGGVLFCAGAALAAAGLEMAEPARRPVFEAEVTGQYGMQTLYAAIERLGWDRAFCDAMIRDNDRTAPAARKSAMIERLLGAMADASA